LALSDSVNCHGRVIQALALSHEVPGKP
jgi:hypothetical protein